MNDTFHEIGGIKRIFFSSDGATRDWNKSLVAHDKDYIFNNMKLRWTNN